jgi:hypothetical protein
VGSRGEFVHPAGREEGEAGVICMSGTSGFAA